MAVPTTAVDEPSHDQTTNVMDRGPMAANTEPTIALHRPRTAPLHRRIGDTRPGAAAPKDVAAAKGAATAKGASVIGHLPSSARAGSTRVVSLGKYQLLHHLASGGMAHVFLARLDGVGGFSRHMVVKTLRRQHAFDPAHIAMFLDEARLLAALHHRNIAQVVDVGVTEDGTHYLAMEYIHGETLRAVLQKTRERGIRLPLDFGLTAVGAAAAALQHVHDRHGADGRWLNMVHRDVTPSNLMASYDGSVTLIDFGIAKAIGRAAHTGAGVIKGKLGYMAPEQALGKPVDRRSDVFSLGVVLYELTTHVHPFAAKSAQEIKMKVLRGDVTPPSRLSVGYPRELEHIVLTAIARDPDHRYPDCGAFAQALTEVSTLLGLTQGPNVVSRVLAQTFGSKPEPWFENNPALPPPVPDDRGAAAARRARRSSAVQAVTRPRTVAPAPIAMVRDMVQARGVELVSPQELQQIVDMAQASVWQPESELMKTTPHRPLKPAAVAVSHPAHPLPVAPAAMAMATPLPFEVASPRPVPVGRGSISEWDPRSATAPPRLSDMPDPDLWAPPVPAPRATIVARPRRNVVREAFELVAVAAAIALIIAGRLEQLLPATDIPSTKASIRVAPVEQPGAPDPAPAQALQPTTPTSQPAPPPAEDVRATPATFSLAVISEPDDATVVLDGVRLGRTPLVLSLPIAPGTAVLKVRHRGYLSRKFEIHLDRDVTIEVRLREPEVEADDEDIAPEASAPSTDSEVPGSDVTPSREETAPEAPEASSKNSPTRSEPVLVDL